MKFGLHAAKQLINNAISSLLKPKQPKPSKKPKKVKSQKPKTQVTTSKPSPKSSKRPKGKKGAGWFENFWRDYWEYRRAKRTIDELNKLNNKNKSVITSVKKQKGKTISRSEVTVGTDIVIKPPKMGDHERNKIYAEEQAFEKQVENYRTNLITAIEKAAGRLNVEDIISPIVNRIKQISTDDIARIYYIPGLQFTIIDNWYLVTKEEAEALVEELDRTLRNYGY